MKDSDRARFDALLGWSRHHGAELHPQLEIYHDHATSFSIRVRPSAAGPLEPGFTAVTCPVATTLSFLNALVDGPLSLSSPSSPSHAAAAAAAAFPRRFMESVPPHVIGRFFLVKEYLRGRDSFWWPYIATLPQPEHVAAWALPPFWPEDDAAYLHGTNAHVAIDEIQANVRREFRHARRLLKDDGFPAWQDYSQMLYKWAFCIFTSRSFRPSLVLSDVAKRHLSRLLPPGCAMDDFSILQPLFDIANHSMTARYAWDVVSDPHCCRLVCRDAYRPGEQVYNNYGLKTNSELLLAYGFVLPETDALHNDYVHVRKRQQQQQQQQSQSQDRGPPADNNPEPTDFLISLRPVHHPSSLVAQSRSSSSATTTTTTTRSSRLSALPGLARFEPALVDDLASALLASPDEEQALERWLSSSAPPGEGERGEHENQQHPTPPPPPPELAQLLARVRGALAGKLQYDFQRLAAVRIQEGEEGGGGKEGGEVEEEEEEEDEEGEDELLLPPPANRNQCLAAEYRRRCERVLSAALRDLAAAECS